MVGPGLEPHEPQEGRKFTRQRNVVGAGCLAERRVRNSSQNPSTDSLVHAFGAPFPVPALCGTAPETGVQVNNPRLLTVRKATY